jgi:hypothetical protein
VRIRVNISCFAYGKKFGEMGMENLIVGVFENLRQNIDHMESPSAFLLRDSIWELIIEFLCSYKVRVIFYWFRQ